MEWYMGGRLMGGSSSINGEQVRVGWELGERAGRMGEFCFSFFLGFIVTHTPPLNALLKQVVWPTKRLLESIQAEVGGDPDWSPDSVYSILRVRE
jgi:hypothetical protein